MLQPEQVATRSPLPGTPPRVGTVTDQDVAPPTGPRLALLRRLGFGDLTHDSHVPFLSHLLGTRRVLVQWGERPALCDAGLFHSAYGTEYFPVDHPASREEVRAVIGDDAEEIAWLWCTIRRDTIDTTGPVVVTATRDGGTLELDDGRAADVATLWAADTVEQIDRMSPDERAFAHSLERVLHLAGPAARRAATAVIPLLDTEEPSGDQRGDERPVGVDAVDGKV